MLDPILQLHQLALQAKQLLEVDMTLEGLLLAMLGHFTQELGQPIIIDLELELLVDGLEHLAVDAMEPCVRVVAHGCTQGGGVRPVRIIEMSYGGVTVCWSMISSENRYAPRIKSGAGLFGIMLYGGVTPSSLAAARSRDHVPCGNGMPSRWRSCKMLLPRSPGR